MNATWLVGGKADCDIVLDFPTVSAHHCLLRCDDQGHWSVEDLASSNGTFLNGTRITAKATVSLADRVTLGQGIQVPWPTDPPTQTIKAITVGRSTVCDRVFSDSRISERHAAVIAQHNGVIIKDLGSTNGTFVGTRDSRIQEERVSLSSKLWLGSEEWRPAEMLAAPAIVTDNLANILPPPGETAFQPQSLRRPRKRAFASYWMSVAAAATALAVVFFIVIAVRPTNEGETFAKRGITPQVNTRKDAIVVAELGKASQFLKGQCVMVIEGKRLNLAWSGSAFVRDQKNGRLSLITNKHCLGFDKFGELPPQYFDLSRLNVNVVSYSLEIKFASGKTRKVTRVEAEDGRLDLARLILAADGLQSPDDFQTLSNQVAVSVGDEVAAVGNPLDEYFENTVTFGKVSAVRFETPGSVACRVIQHTAAINSGNSGGPLLRISNGRASLCGINTWTIANSEGLMFAIDAAELSDARFKEYSCGPEGVTQMLKDRFGINAKSTPVGR